MKKYEEYFYILIKKYIKKEDEEFFLFTMRNLDLNNMIVWGSKVNESGMQYCSEKIPSIILNFSVQYKKENINKLRKLHQLEEIKLINETNRFDQSIIFEILSSNNSVKKYLLDYKTISLLSSINLNTENSYIFMPIKGADLTKVVHMSLDGLDVLIKNNNNYFEIDNEKLNRKLFKITKVRRGILMTVERDIVSEEALFTVRVYLQRGESGDWNIVIRRMNFKGRNQAFILNKNLEEAALNIVKCIANYIPSMAAVFIDFFVSNEGTPYFLHFGGWSKMLIDNKNNSTLNKKFSNNLMKYIKSLS